LNPKNVKISDEKTAYDTTWAVCLFAFIVDETGLSVYVMA